ncbi:hypothetical protein ACRW2U_19660, partial [Escherichia coli]
MKIKLALLIAFAGFSAGASAEIAEFSFKDTLNVKKTVSPASVWINPVTSFDVAVISGLDRYITLSLLKSDGSLIWSTKSGTVAKLAMRQPFVLFKGLTFQKLCLPGAFRPGD